MRRTSTRGGNLTLSIFRRNTATTPAGLPVGPSSSQVHTRVQPASFRDDIICHQATENTRPRAEPLAIAGIRWRALVGDQALSAPDCMRLADARRIIDRNDEYNRRDAEHQKADMDVFNALLTADRRAVRH